MPKIVSIGSCLSGVTASILAGIYRWELLNRATIDRTDLFIRYFLNEDPMPDRASVERLLAVKTEHAAEAAVIFHRMFRDTAGLVELPKTKPPLFETLRSEKVDLILLDNTNDTHSHAIRYTSRNRRGSFDFLNFPLVWSSRYDDIQDRFRYLPRLSSASSAENWAEIVDRLRTLQPEARIVFLCAPSTTLASDPERQAHADQFEQRFRAALGTTALDIVPQMEVPLELTKMPGDIDHFHLSFYRALAGWIVMSSLLRPVLTPGELGGSMPSQIDGERFQRDAVRGLQMSH